MVNKAQHGTSYLNVYYQKIKIHVDTVKYVKVKQQNIQYDTLINALITFKNILKIENHKFSLVR